MSDRMQTFSIEIPLEDEEKMEKFQEVMDDVVNETNFYIENLATTLGVNERVAADIWYLRTRARWTQELENQIIAAAKAGCPIDSGSILNGEWPPEHENPLESIGK